MNDRIGGNRRGAASTLQPYGKVLVQVGRWEEFVRTSGVGGVNLHKYYVPGSGIRLTNAEYELLLRELFTDAVAVGAIVLPAPYVSGDLLFKMASAEKIYRKQVQLSLKGRPETVAMFDSVHEHLGPGRRIASLSVTDAVGHIGRYVSTLVSKAAS